MAGEAPALGLQITVDGAPKAVNDLNTVAAASRDAASAATRGSGSFTGLSRELSNMAGANRQVYMAMSGISEAINTAEGSWKKFTSRLGETTMFAGAVIGFEMVIKAAQKMSAQADDAWKSAGVGAQGFWKNWLIGAGIMDAPKVKGAADAIVLTAEQKAQTRGKLAKTFIEQSRDEDSPEKETVRWTEANKGVAYTQKEILAHYKDQVALAKELRKTEETRKRITEGIERGKAGGKRDWAAEIMAPSLDLLLAAVAHGGKIHSQYGNSPDEIYKNLTTAIGAQERKIEPEIREQAKHYEEWQRAGTRFAGAAEVGSAEAYSTLVMARAGEAGDIPKQQLDEAKLLNAKIDEWVKKSVPLFVMN